MSVISFINKLFCTVYELKSQVIYVQADNDQHTVQVQELLNGTNIPQVKTVNIYDNLGNGIIETQSIETFSKVVERDVDQDNIHFKDFIYELVDSSGNKTNKAQIKFVFLHSIVKRPKLKDNIVKSVNCHENLNITKSDIIKVVDTETILVSDIETVHFIWNLNNAVLEPNKNVFNFEELSSISVQPLDYTQNYSAIGTLTIKSNTNKISNTVQVSLSGAYCENLPV